MTEGMRVPGVVFASPDLLPAIEDDESLQQVVNVACLPGVVGASYAMPDVHWGYGFPIGGVAATDVEAGGVVSPGGVGFDISCGVRLLTTGLGGEEVSGCLDRLMDRLAEQVPCGLGRGGVWSRRSDPELDDILVRGAVVAVEAGFGFDGDLVNCEDRGSLGGADPAMVSVRARERGRNQVGSLGSGNHFVEVQVVDRILDGRRADAFGLRVGEVCVMIHTGSRGLGHQVCTDHIHVMEASMARYGVSVPDRQLACAPVRSEEGAAYLAAMAAAANYGRTNRQLLTHAVRHVFGEVLGTGDLPLLYDVSHNLAKLEVHEIEGERRLLCVHRKGATRALPPGHVELPEGLRRWGQPVLVPGSMGTASYVLVGTGSSAGFDSCCHGAGRVLSRHAVKRRVRGDELARGLAAEGIHVRAGSMRGLAEEAPFAYKDVDSVVSACEEAGLAHVVARMRPVGVVKG